ncbi:gluconokinase [Ensifer sp. B1-9]|uniref:gluconokinase n=1 Tax=Ensifer sp. B1-9 TaxID=3141455 RepID=UPI003D20951E
MVDGITDRRPPCAQVGPILVMGVAGTGKSEIASRLAAALDGTFIEADSYHSVENVERMRRGIGLTDAERWPWLSAVATAALDAGTPGPVVIACSTLKRRYRDFLRERIGPLRILYLAGSPELIAKRLAGRKGHFASRSLLESQMSTLEPPSEDEESVIRVDIRLAPEAIIAAALARLENEHSV